MDKPKFPRSHKPLVVLPNTSPGFSCATCKYVDAESHTCGNIYYQKFYGTDKLPDGDLTRMCSDWWEPQKANNGNTPTY